MAVPADMARDGVTPPPGSGADDRCPHCGVLVEDAWLVCGSCGEAVAAAAALPVGTRLGHDRFEVLGVLGRGGFGITYDVMDHRLQRRVAVKELFPESAVRHGSVVLTPPHARDAFRDARSRFLREARVLARFTHSGIVRVYEVFEEHNSAYLVMELLEGRTLLDLLAARGRPFSEAEVLDVAARAAVALRSVHAAGVLHRDINPSNIVLTDHGRIVVIDFGIARSYAAEQSTSMTRVVTPGYAPIEQYVGEGRFGPASDVYGLAATLYRLATGRVPVSALEREGGKSLPAPHSLNPGISKAVSDGLLDGLELNPDHRPQTLDAFLLRLGLRVSDARPPRSLLLDSVPAAHHAVTAAASREEEARLEDATEVEPRPAEPPASPGDAKTLGAPPTAVAPRPAGGPAPSSVASRAPAAPSPIAVPLSVPRRAVGLPPIAIGPHPPGRWKAIVPLAATALAFGSAAPVSAFIVLVLVVLPLLATWGDSVVHRFRRDSGTAQRWVERATPPAAAAPVRLVGNVMMSILRSLPVATLTAALLGLWYGLDHLPGVPQPALDAVLRGIGLLVSALLVLPAGRGSPRFRTGIAVDEVVTRLVSPAGRLVQTGVVVWVIAVAAVAGSFWLTPEVWPLPH